ncbi:Emsy N Terminus (ENT)/ plant Tudor-like domains-containing protein [Euphorbia peplus]|nr:Emsy N Terminus (ENT)/ plant Tudor-like domains-containing protein [Euphorbia peplus]
MDYDGSDSSGTDDDLPPHQQSILKRERILGNGRSGVGSGAYSRIHIDMEAQIHHLEQEAYSAVLRAFKAQSDAITWEKEGLITELRKELRVSDDQHRELLTQVNGDEIIKRIREWRQAGGHQPTRSSASQPIHDVVPSPTISGSRKRQKTSQSGQAVSGLPSKKYMQYPSTASAGNHHYISHSSSGALPANEHAEATPPDPLLGRKVWTRWPEDNTFYEAVITDCSKEGRHALVYDINTANETWEWVNLKEMSAEDIQWEGADPGITYRGGVRGGPGRGIRKPISHGGYPSFGRVRGSIRGQSKTDFNPTQNGYAKTLSEEIELFNTESLVEEVERVFALSQPDPHELEKAKRMLREHEQALIDAISRLADTSDNESGEHQYLHGEAMEPE